MMRDNPSLTIKVIYKKHKAECPSSMISEDSIRRAVKNGTLPCIKVGNRALISWEVFESWRNGELNHVG